jgi:hypothetical protein
MESMLTELGLGEDVLRKELEEELLRAIRAEGDVPTVHAIAHAVARVIQLDHMKIAEQLRAAGIDLRRTER